MYDLIVVGGGPAGSSAARKAAQRGMKTLLIEKQSFPRYKACAGALSRRALDALDLTIPEGIREKEIFGLRLAFKGETIEARNDSLIAVTVTRSRFDEYLLAKACEAGALVHTEEKVLSIDEHDDHLVVRTGTSVYEARYAAVSEGAQGSLSKTVRQVKRKNGVALSMVARAEADNHAIDERLPGLLEIHIDMIRMGYCWIFPHDGYYSVGLWGFIHYLHDPRGTMKTFLKRTGFSEDLQLRGHLIPTGETAGSLATSRVLVTGDAAGFVDPLTGEGISYAIRSGQIAADVVADAVTGEQGCSGITRYEEACRAEFGDNFIYARRMARATYRLPSFFFHLLASDSQLYRMLLAAPAMKRLYLDYLMWLLPRLHRSFFYYLRGNVLRHSL